MVCYSQEIWVLNEPVCVWILLRMVKSTRAFDLNHCTVRQLIVLAGISLDNARRLVRFRNQQRRRACRTRKTKRKALPRKPRRGLSTKTVRQEVKQQFRPQNSERSRVHESNMDVASGSESVILVNVRTASGQLLEGQGSGRGVRTRRGLRLGVRRRRGHRRGPRRRPRLMKLTHGKPEGRSELKKRTPENSRRRPLRRRRAQRHLEDDPVTRKLSDEMCVIL